MRRFLLPAGEDTAEAQLSDGLERGDGVARHVEGAVEGNCNGNIAIIFNETEVYGLNPGLNIPKQTLA